MHDNSASLAAPGPANPSALSPAQERSRFSGQLHPGATVHNAAVRFRIKGALDCSVLEEAFESVVRENPRLQAGSDLGSGLATESAGPELHILECDEETAVLEAARPFDLVRGPLLRAVVLRRAACDHEFLLVHHEAAEDTSALLRQLGDYYSALKRGEPPPPRDDRDSYSIDKGIETPSLEYWTAALKDAPLLELAADRPRPDRRTLRGGSIPFSLAPEAAGRFDAFIVQNGLSFSGALMAIFQVMLHRHSGQDRISTGFRGPEPNEDTLVVVSGLSGNPPLRDFARTVEQNLGQARRHGGVGFDAIVEAVNPPRSTRHTPLFQALLEIRPAGWNRLILGDLEVAPLPVHSGTSRFDLTLSAWRSADTIEGALEYSSDLFDEESARRMLRHFETLASAVDDDARGVATLPMLTPEERSTILFDWNRTGCTVPRASIHERIVDRCRRTPERVAVVCGGEQLTYGELDARAEALAYRLQALGIGPGSLAGVCVERSVNMVVAVLGVLKSGAAYVPLDPAYPAERLEYMLRHSGAGAIVTERAHASQFASATALPVFVEDLVEDEPRGSLPPSGGLAYVIYTSGSTGLPKGVAIRHEALANFIESMRREPGFSESDVMLAVTTLCFDIAGLELFLPLATGGCVVIATRDEARDGARLKDLIETRGVTVMQATPATWPLLIEAGWTGDGRLKALCGGEAMPKALAEQLLARAGSVWNMYGPTETTVWSSVYRVRGGERNVPVGKPIANTQFHIVDRFNQPLPAGVPGELLIGGAGLAAGYLNDPEKTASRFIPNPIPGTPGERLYRTGDLARWLPDGNVEHLGRMDNQIKLRGFRIELGEIEAVLASHAGVRNCAVTVQDDERGEKALVAFVTPARGCVIGEPELRSLLKRKLPEHMLPAAIAFLDEMPQTPNGKIDRKALPRIQRAAPERSAAPGDATELRLFEIWTDVLGVRPASADQSFFDLGGHSLTAARALARIEREFGKKLPLAALFAAPTVAGLAAMLRAGGAVRWPRTVTVQPEGTDLPFLFVGGGFRFLKPLAQRLHALGFNRPFLSLAHPRVEDLRGRSVEDLAAWHVDTVLELQPSGPYCLGGFCAEGVVAYEMAQQLIARGREVAWLGLFEAENRADRRMARDLLTITATFSPTADRISLLRREGLVRYVSKRASKAWKLIANCVSPRMDPMGGPDFLIDFTKLKLYRPKPYAGRAHLFRRCLDGRYYPDPNLGWGGLIADFAAFEIPGSHLGMFQEPVVEVLARQVTEAITGTGQEARFAAGQS